MQNPLTTDYKGYAIEPLVYPFMEPKRSKQLTVRRYRAAVHITNNETQVKQTAKLPTDFEFFGDARRAAVTHGKHLIDNPEAAQEAWQVRTPEAVAEVAAEANAENGAE